jgi:hypothetical protein
MAWQLATGTWKPPLPTITHPGCYIENSYLELMHTSIITDNIFFENNLKKVINIAPYSVQKSSKAHPA